jgi:hypothetical protein
MIWFIAFIVYAYIAIWWQQITFTFLYNEMDINFNRAITEEQRFKMLIRILFITFLWPITILIAIKKVGLTEVTTSMTSYEWSMMFKDQED